MNTTLKTMLSSFIQSIDVFNCLLKDHHRQTAVIAWHIGQVMGLSTKEISNLILSASLHDIGALSISERDELVKMDIENPHPHSRLGAYMLDSFQPFEKISQIIFYHHWSYDNDSNFITERGPVPLESYIIHVADRIDILIDPETPILFQENRIKEKIKSYSGSLFHPDVVNAFEQICSKTSFWLDIENLPMHDLLRDSLHEDLNITMDLDLLENLAFTFSKVIDCRSKFTASHSFGVSEVAYEIGKRTGYSESKCRKLRIAGLLHDVGKICVPNEIIEKDGPLTPEERTTIKKHAYFSGVILRGDKSFEEIANWASHHHESHKGNGYPNNYSAKQISEEMDIIAYADILTALSENRPYRKGLSIDKISSILEEFREDHGSKILDIIQADLPSINNICRHAIQDGLMRYDIYESLVKKYEHEMIS